MIRRPPRSTRTDTLFPYTTLFRSSQPYLDMLSAFRFLPIATLTLQLEQPWQLPHPMMLLRDDPGTLQFGQWLFRSEEHTSELQSLMRISYAVFCLKKKKKKMQLT